MMEFRASRFSTHRAAVAFEEALSRLAENASRSESFALFRFISPKIPIFKSATSTLLHQSSRLVALRPAWGSYSAALELTGRRARTIAKTVYL
jgi:hypothetical protein